MRPSVAKHIPMRRELKADSATTFHVVSTQGRKAHPDEKGTERYVSSHY